MYKNFRILLITFLFFCVGCDSYQEYTIPPKYIFIKYKYSNNIGTPSIRSFKKNYKIAFKNGKITSETRNDTTFLKLLDNNGTLRTDRQPWRYEKRVKASKLSCRKKLKINVERLTFYFCYAEVKEFVNKLSESKDEFLKERYTAIKRELSTIEVKYDENELNFGDGYFLSRLLRNVDFEIVDAGSENITEVRIGDVNTSWSILDELYLLNHEQDTVAALFNTYLIQ